VDNNTGIGQLLTVLPQGVAELRYVVPCSASPWVSGLSGLKAAVLVLGASAILSVDRPVIHGAGVAFGMPSSVGVALRERRESGHRRREAEWRAAHQRELEERYAGSWIALDADRILAHGPDALAVVREARTKGVRSPYVFLVEAQRKGVAWLSS
jgi:hypothetical protein